MITFGMCPVEMTNQTMWGPGPDRGWGCVREGGLLEWGVGVQRFAGVGFLCVRVSANRMRRGLKWVRGLAGRGQAAGSAQQLTLGRTWASSQLRLQ